MSLCVECKKKAEILDAHIVTCEICYKPFEVSTPASICQICSELGNFCEICKESIDDY